ncbi:type VII secretion target [Kibdelosporangium aridum]|uniref:type VII secretion target n=1 Tax=Kibdelosporangium aridum TaxID=2030 RepID=UPI00052500B7
MPDGYGVLPDELRAHASRLNGLQDRLNTALDAANQVALGDQAYGVICSFFVPIVHAVSAPGVTALRGTATAMGETSVGVKTTATSYDDVEQSNTQPFAGAL